MLSIPIITNMLWCFSMKIFLALALLFTSCGVQGDGQKHWATVVSIEQRRFILPRTMFFIHKFRVECRYDDTGDIEILIVSSTVGRSLDVGHKVLLQDGRILQTVSGSFKQSGS